MKKILVPLDGTGFAETVLPHAETLAKSEGAEIILLRVPVLPSTIFVSQDPVLASIALADTINEAEDYIKSEVDKLKHDGCQVTGLTQNGMISTTILEVAETTHADAIVMSTHARTGFQRWLKGSVADQIVHQTRIPVILVHPN
jgi:nucleotide-binding universal stress UspA family protein